MCHKVWISGLWQLLAAYSNVWHKKPFEESNKVAVHLGEWKPKHNKKKNFSYTFAHSTFIKTDQFSAIFWRKLFILSKAVPKYHRNSSTMTNKYLYLKYYVIPAKVFSINVDLLFKSFCFVRNWTLPKIHHSTLFYV